MLRRHLLSVAASVLVALTFCVQTARAQGPPASDVVIVLPFENKNNQREFNWVGESFADSLAELLNMPGSGLTVVSSDEREMAYQRLRLPQTILPSRATAIKIAREARATLVVLGTYEVTAAQGEGSLPALTGTARVIRVNEGRLTGETMHFGGTLTDLQKMQGRLVFEVLYQHDKALPISLQTILAQATKVPPTAFESYVKGALTTDAEKKSNYLQNALREYKKVNAGAEYPQAAFELGMLFLERGDWKRGAEYFSMLQEKDPHYVEAAFYAAYSYWKMDDLVRALGALMPLKEMKLTGIYNNAGAISTQAARAERDATERARLLEQAAYFLGLAASSAPDDPMVRFNYGYALLLAGKNAEAVEQLRPVIKQDAKDGAALFLFAKALERTGQTEAATINDNEARRWLPSYAKLQTDWQRSQSIELPLRLREKFNRSDYIADLQDRAAARQDVLGSGSQDLLVKARELYTAGRDDEALQELRNVVRVEPMNAEAYLLIGRIDQRRGDLQAAISALKTALFWEAKLIDAHILLGRIFFERGDRTMAMSYVRNALQIDPNNQEAIGLQRQITTNTK
ncbi:MAG TPA: tetratricopeptide repeat protein [Pyrinomonadaceae bacterium]|jgi:tetratricopeptide (TPR) repeat protein/TolB-like protein|nr:tetratricopeptide repeat protein [Pyrinomonadaceae bacterium]